MYDQNRVDCLETTEILSAELDGEAGEEEWLAAEAHLDGCADCRQRYEAMTAITRSVRLLPAEPGPDVTASVLPAWQPRRLDRLRGRAGRRLRMVLRGMLALVAAVQLLVALLQLTGMGVSVHTGPAFRGTMPHISHETGAWNAAIAVALGWVALRAHHATAHLPVLLSFACVLFGLSGFDLVLDNVSTARVASHLPILLGVLLVAGLAVLRSEESGPDIPQARRPEQSTDIDGDEAPEPVVLRRRRSAPPSARHRESA
ncbi:putative anti-sigma-YlaC factor YlaD [Halopolyspora algeriensis]|uniref:Putative anti-sigma-YlaC factor YlaD n=1 Tax=Halopolyspora algeriensis TaxID=1500506 RepID=A0A368VIF0_9ACTN|nr:zf-HC2 domain-containing protein [Halopolyspora algeriensis]RCW41037.1 putative anti-sigma-YlaC factor YlaD [Halopolyspora algeriensis]TQM53879.1 putative anti-sigma-YlaC factor YlaD [Halopolyspora algeriensis]